MKKILFILILLAPLFLTTKADVPASSGPGFTVSPNPVSGSYFYVNIAFTESEFPNTSINITNILGQVVYTYHLKAVDYTNKSIMIDLADSKLDKGMYFVQLKSGDNTKTQKIAVR